MKNDLFFLYTEDAPGIYSIDLLDEELDQLNKILDKLNRSKNINDLKKKIKSIYILSDNDYVVSDIKQQIYMNFNFDKFVELVVSMSEYDKSINVNEIITQKITASPPRSINKIYKNIKIYCEKSDFNIVDYIAKLLYKYPVYKNLLFLLKNNNKKLLISKILAEKIYGGCLTSVIHFINHNNYSFLYNLNKKDFINYFLNVQPHIIINYNVKNILSRMLDEVEYKKFNEDYYRINYYNLFG